MAGIIKKLYHPQTNGTVTTAGTPELQELYPITATSAVYAPQEAGSMAGQNLDQILAGKQNTLVSGVNIKTINGNSLLGPGDLTVGGGGGGSSTLDQYLGFDAEAGAVYVKNNYGFYSNSFISAGGVGSGGGGTGGDGNATSIGGVPVSLSSLTLNDSLIYSGGQWINGKRYRAVGIKPYGYTQDPTGKTITDVCQSQNINSLYFEEGDGISLTKPDASNTIVITATGGGSGTGVAAGNGLQLNGTTMSVKAGDGLGFDSSGNLKVTYSYSLPTASNSTLGGVKVGTDLSIDSNGVLSVDRTTLDGRYVHLSGNGTNSSAEEEINGLKTFLSGIALNPNTDTVQHTIYYDTQNRELVIKGPVRIDGNLYASGSVTAGT